MCRADLYDANLGLAEFAPPITDARFRTAKVFSRRISGEDFAKRKVDEFTEWVRPQQEIRWFHR
jgi:hypothetical protein